MNAKIFEGLKTDVELVSYFGPQRAAEIKQKYFEFNTWAGRQRQDIRLYVSDVYGRSFEFTMEFKLFLGGYMTGRDFEFRG